MFISSHPFLKAWINLRVKLYQIGIYWYIIFAIFADSPRWCHTWWYDFLLRLGVHQNKWQLSYQIPSKDIIKLIISNFVIVFYPPRAPRQSLTLTLYCTIIPKFSRCDGSATLKTFYSSYFSVQENIMVVS